MDFRGYVSFLLAAGIGAGVAITLLVLGPVRWLVLWFLEHVRWVP